MKTENFHHPSNLWATILKISKHCFWWKFVILFPRKFFKQDLKEKWWALWYFLRNTVLKLTNFASLILFFTIFFLLMSIYRTSIIFWECYFLITHKQKVSYLKIITKQSIYKCLKVSCYKPEEHPRFMEKHILLI